ncbi:MBL fold metallo-hydrolase RNA specificity domain-containing protein [Planctomycetota bacterium]
MDIRLSFLGATRNVTGSRYLLETNGKQILIDCGLYQERQFKGRNWDPFPVPADKLDAVLLTHAHLDHCGLLPKLVKEGFKGPIHCTKATADIAQIVMNDSARIQVEDIEHKKKRHARQKRKSPYPLAPLYTVENAEACAPLFRGTTYHKPVSICEGVTATYYDTGHILGASAIQVKVQQNGETRTILFSGDVGRWNKPILQDPHVIEQADYVLCESTYGDRIHPTGEDIKKSLCAIINETRDAGGNVIVPSFAVERSQELLYYLNELLDEECIPNLLAFLDSPMAVKVTEVFKKHPDLFDEETREHLRNNNSPFDLPGLSLVRTANQSKAINLIRGTAIIIAGSGMCTGGRIKHHLVNNITRPETTVLFVGYQAEGTLGRRIVEGEKEVRILGENYPVRARVAQIQGFSGHADRDELTQWLSHLKQAPRHLFVVHGEVNAAEHFAEHIKTEKGWETSVPKHNDTVTLD